MIQVASVPISLDAQLQLRKQWREQLTSILNWWSSVAVDYKNGGYYGAVSNENKVNELAPKGTVMLARICWAFSEACRFHPRNDWANHARRAFEYITNHCWDHEWGGTYWSVTATGAMHDGRKQFYGQAFVLYAFAAYYRITQDGVALHLAKDLFEFIEDNSFDKQYGGYIEAVSRQKLPLDDQRLSDKDENAAKSCNTHLHILEAYVLLYKVSPDKKLKERIHYLLNVFHRKFITTENTLQLFFTLDWQPVGDLRSFGHEIEAAWLLYDAATCIEDAELKTCFEKHAIGLVHSALQAMDEDGALWYEYNPSSQTWIYEKHSWPQAEAMLAFVVLAQLTGEAEWMERAIKSWKFIQQYLVDAQHGEWYWGINREYEKMDKDKAGFWKCPYHSTRSLLEVLYRLTV